MKQYQITDLTALEVVAIESAKGTVEGTGYIYFDDCELINGKQMRGVMSSLSKKGIIEVSYDQDFEASPTKDYEDWFPGLYS